MDVVPNASHGQAPGSRVGTGAQLLANNGIERTHVRYNQPVSARSPLMPSTLGGRMPIAGRQRCEEAGLGDPVHANPVPLASLDFGWIVGRSIANYSFHEPDLWSLSFSGGGRLQTQSPWRALAAGCVVASSADHGHKFGLPEPVDVATLASRATGESRVAEARIGNSAPDLELHLENGATLQVLALSTGYECWQVTDPAGIATVVHGDGHASSWTEPEVT